MKITSRVLVLVVVVLLVGCGASPSLTLTDSNGQEVGVVCASGVPTADCRAAATAMLEFIPADAARVEGIRVEPLEDPPAGSGIALLVTVDHEMSLQSGEQAYTLVRTSGSEEFDIQIVTD